MPDVMKNMRINLYSDAPHHNLALMKLSAYYRQQDAFISFNMPIIPCDFSYASILFEKNKKMFFADEFGGPAFENSVLPKEVENIKPDYNLYNLDYSLGYTFRPCYRGCSFCKVSKMNHPDTNHHSIWEFHNLRFKKICLLNNNTFMDKQWKETFEEIWDADLSVIDENGYDLRLLDDEKCEMLKKTKFVGKLHFAWDRMKDETKILKGLELLRKWKTRGSIYVLIGYDTTEKEDLYRCQKIIDLGHTPYIMPFNQSKREKRFKRFIDSFMWRKYKTIKEAWKNYV